MNVALMVLFGLLFMMNVQAYLRAQKTSERIAAVFLAVLSVFLVFAYGTRAAL